MCVGEVFQKLNHPYNFACFSHQKLKSAVLYVGGGDGAPLISNVIGRLSDTFSKVHTHLVSHWTQTVLGPWFD